MLIHYSVRKGTYSATVQVEYQRGDEEKARTALKNLVFQIDQDLEDAENDDQESLEVVKQ